MRFEKLGFETITGNFKTQGIYGNTQVSLSLHDFGTTAIDKATMLANEIGEWLDKNLQGAKQFAASQLITLKNDSWLEENQQPIDEFSFAGTLDLNSISAFSEGSFEIYFNDNDLFWGHLIRVDIDKDFKWISAAITG